MAGTEAILANDVPAAQPQIGKDHGWQLFLGFAMRREAG